MESNTLPQEIENYIQESEKQREQKGYVDYDTCQQILAYAAEYNSDELFGKGYYYFAEYYWNKNDTKQAMHCLSECTKCFYNVKLYDQLAKTYNMMGVVSDSIGNRLIALNYYYRGKGYAQQQGDIYVQAMMETNIADALIGMKHYQKAIEHYGIAIGLYQNAESRSNRNRNILYCMVFSGLCYLLLGQRKEVLDMRSRIVQFRQNHKIENIQYLALHTFEASCEMLQGNREKADRYVKQVMEMLHSPDNRLDYQTLVIVIANLYDSYQNDAGLKSILELMDRKNLEDNVLFYLDMYPFKTRELLEYHDRKGYIAYTRKYLEVYRRNKLENRVVTRNIMELQDELSRVESEQRQIVASNQRLEQIALYDSMTRLPNRAYLNEYFSTKFEEAFQEQKILGVELMDIDFFKQYNDTYGHLSGDICIEKIADVLREVKGTDERIFCARYGGDEFMVIYTDMEIMQMERTAGLIQNRVRELGMEHKNSQCSPVVSVSQGVFAKIPDEENREWDFNSMADVVLYQAKKDGRDRFRIQTAFE